MSTSDPLKGNFPMHHRSKVIAKVADEIEAELATIPKEEVPLRRSPFSFARGP